MRVLVACEESGVVRDAFRARGYDAWSADKLPGRGKGALFHIRCDLRMKTPGWYRTWDLALCFPPCDRLLVAGALYWKKWQRSGEQQKGIEFFMSMVELPIDKIVVENPVRIMSTVYRPPDQYIEPWMFGHMETKKTGLWLKNLPLLAATNNVHTEMMKLPTRLRNRVHHESPGVKNGLTRSQRRAVTFTGIADAFADQYGGLACV